MKKIVFVIVISCLLFACSKTEPSVNESRKTYSGTITGKMADEYIMTTEDGELVNINSRGIKLEDYMNKKIKIEGMFSGSTFYGDKIVN